MNDEVEDTEGDDVEGHVVTWDTAQLMALPPSGVAPAAEPRPAPAVATAPAARRRGLPRFGRPAPSPSAG